MEHKFKCFNQHVNWSQCAGCVSCSLVICHLGPKSSFVISVPKYKVLATILSLCLYRLFPWAILWPYVFEVDVTRIWSSPHIWSRHKCTAWADKGFMTWLRARRPFYFYGLIKKARMRSLTQNPFNIFLPKSVHPSLDYYAECFCSLDGGFIFFYLFVIVQ